jgi:hypothetical protein
MDSANKFQQISHISIADQLIDGKMKISSVEEFESILELFPEEPELQRLYAYMLAKKNRPNAAAESYSKASDMFIDSGMMLQAIFSKRLQWRIKPPSRLNEVRDFVKKLQHKKFPDQPVNTFFSMLTPPTLLAILRCFVVQNFPKGKMIKTHGNEEKCIFFVVSGTLEETTFHSVEIEGKTLYQKTKMTLYENDFFGTIYPFAKEHYSHSYVETASRVEVIKLDKADLSRICNKYRDVEPGLIELYRLRSDWNENRAENIYRKEARHLIPAKIGLKIFSKSPETNPLTIEGNSRDISIGGICVFVDKETQNIELHPNSIVNSEAQVSLQNESMTLTVAGVIRWVKEIHLEDNKAVALGIKFKEMSPKLRGTIFTFVDSIYSQKQEA